MNLGKIISMRVLDIRTRGREGLPVRSIKSGWVNRLKVSLSGYGKVLYIEHNDGLVSVYAHLKKFNPRIESYLKKKQYIKNLLRSSYFLVKMNLKLMKEKLSATAVILEDLLVRTYILKLGKQMVKFL